jgi:hypothetical protein
VLPSRQSQVRLRWSHVRIDFRMFVNARCAGQGFASGQLEAAGRRLHVKTKHLRKGAKRAIALIQVYNSLAISLL